MEAVSNAWDGVDWDRLQTRIESEISALGTRQDDSEERRKRLVEESNSYREKTTKDSRKVAVPLIKAFQQEFDGLIARSQAAESALIDVFSQITNLPDPKALLKGAEAWRNDAEKTKRAVEEREGLKEQLQQSQQELASLKNQDVEVRKLKEEITRLEEQHEKQIDRTVDESERKIRDEFEIRIEEMSLKHEKMRQENGILEKRVNELDAKNRESQRRLDVAKMTVDQHEALESEQLAIAIKDLADANHRIVILEEKLTQVTRELADVNEKKARGGLEDIAALGGLMIEKDEQINRMSDERRTSEKRHEEEIKKWKEKMNVMEKEQSRQRATVDDLKKQLASKFDYEAIKKELRLLREIEFGSAADANSESIERLGETVETLDRLLAEKNRRLQNENASLRVMNEGFKASLDENREESSKLRERCEKSEQLVVKLESDLASAIGGGEGSHEMSTLDVLRQSSADNGMGASVDGSTSTSTSTRHDTSLVPILTSQRNRLHEKVTQLEEMLAVEKTRQLSVQTEVEKVREDNVKLYDKVRFLQGGSNKNTKLMIDNDILSDSYETPFKKFSTSERNNKMQLHDRATLNIGRAILSSAKSRLIFFFYLLVLHVLIMLVLYKFAYDESSLRDQETECEYKFSQHMIENHAEH